MFRSMTGFGRREAAIPPIGKICAELRSTNHKFLEIAIHLPEGFLVLEDKIKKEIEVKIKRGRVTCVISMSKAGVPGVFINRPLLKDYVLVLKNVKKQFRIQDTPSIDTLIHLPGVLSLVDRSPAHQLHIWPKLKLLVNQALDELVQTRQKEGRALTNYLRNRAQILNTNLGMIKSNFKKVMQDKLAKLETDEERAGFLKDKDITEEMERLTFHIRNFKNRLTKASPIGKELDFIAQEMQREANTIAAKSCDAVISARVIQTKSQIEKIREQVQNIE